MREEIWRIHKKIYSSKATVVWIKFVYFARMLLAGLGGSMYYVQVLVRVLYSYRVFKDMRCLAQYLYHSMNGCMQSHTSIQRVNALALSHLPDGAREMYECHILRRNSL